MIGTRVDSIRKRFLLWLVESRAPRVRSLRVNIRRIPRFRSKLGFLRWMSRGIRTVNS